MSIIREIIGMCSRVSELDYCTDVDDIHGAVSEYNKVTFKGTIDQCHNYISLYKRMAKHKQVADLLEEICRANIQGLNEWGDFDGCEPVAQNWMKEVEAVYLSDEEVNERAIQEKQG